MYERVITYPHQGEETRVWLAPTGAADDIGETEDGKYPSPGDCLVSSVSSFGIVTVTFDHAYEGCDSITERKLMLAAKRYLQVRQHDQVA